MLKSKSKRSSQPVQATKKGRKAFWQKERYLLLCTGRKKTLTSCATGGGRPCLDLQIPLFIRIISCTRNTVGKTHVSSLTAVFAFKTRAKCAFRENSSSFAFNRFIPKRKKNSIQTCGIVLFSMADTSYGHNLWQTLFYG